MIDLILIVLFVSAILLYEYINNKEAINLEGENVKSFLQDLLIALIITMLAGTTFLVMFNLIKLIL